MYACPLCPFSAANFKEDNLSGGLFLEKTDSPSYSSSLVVCACRISPSRLPSQLTLSLRRSFFFLTKYSVQIYGCNFPVIYGSHYILHQISWYSLFILVGGSIFTGSAQASVTGDGESTFTEKMIFNRNEAESWLTHII